MFPPKHTWSKKLDTGVAKKQINAKNQNNIGGLHTAYTFLIEFSVDPEFGNIDDVRKFSDELRSFLKKYKISKYDHLMEAEHTFKAVYTFTKSFDSLDDSRKYLDEVRKFLNERGFKRHSYHIIAERTE